MRTGVAVFAVKAALPSTDLITRWAAELTFQASSFSHSLFLSLDWRSFPKGKQLSVCAWYKPKIKAEKGPVGKEE